MSNSEFNNILISQADFLKPFAISLTHDPEAAKDLFQETLYKALSNQEKYNAGTNIKAWLYTIMRNIFINDYRRKARQKTIFDPTPNDYYLDSRQAVGNTAEAVIGQKEIMAAIDQLPNIFKIPFLLYFDGYKYHEIADMLHEPLCTIKSRIHFARKLLKAQIERF